MKRSLQFGLIALFTLASSCDLTFAPGNFKPHVYLSWRSEDTATTLLVSYHTQGEFQESAVYYDTESRGGDPALYRFKKTGTSVSWPGTSRSVHHVELTDLDPGRPYFFITGDPQSGFTPERKFKTLRRNSAGLRIVNGGDMGTGSKYVEVTQQAAATNPDVALLGGDIAYADGNPKKTDLWDKWLETWTSKMITSDGFTIPFILAIGNHETNLLKSFSDKKVKAPFYYTLFNQDPSERSFFTRQLGQDIMLYVLDTAHIYAPFGKQRKWLAQALENTKQVRTKIALYHAGLYPSYRSYYNPHNSLGRISWLGLFDHFRMSLALEAHDHTMKRTKYLRDGKVRNPGEGTLYLGDGAWGKRGRDVDPGRWYLEKAESITHFWLLEVGDSEITATAIDETGRAFDTHTMPRVSIAAHRANPIGAYRDDTGQLLQQIQKDEELSPYLEMLKNE
ncbi:MAG: fibronectin type III domain-containing protein [Oligoflexia bacterium]